MRKWNAQARWRSLLLNKPPLLLPALFSSKTSSFFRTLLEKNEGRVSWKVEIGENNSFQSLSGTEKRSHHHHLEGALVRPQSWKSLKTLTAPRHVECWSESLLIIEMEWLPVWLRPSRYDDLHLRRKSLPSGPPAHFPSPSWRGSNGFLVGFGRTGRTLSLEFHESQTFFFLPTNSRSRSEQHTRGPWSPWSPCRGREEGIYFRTQTTMKTPYKHAINSLRNHRGTTQNTEIRP